MDQIFPKQLIGGKERYDFVHLEMDEIISTISQLTNDRARMSTQGLTSYRSVEAMRKRRTEVWRDTIVTNRPDCAIAPIWVGSAKWGALIYDPDDYGRYEIYQFDASGQEMARLRKSHGFN